MSGLRNLPEQVTIYEVGPRDGLQNESRPVAAEAKVRFINMLSLAGLPAIEVTSFVRSGVIPQLSDAAEVCAALTHAPGTLYTALVPNERGMERAMTSGLGGVALFTAASESFSRKNVNASIGETLERFRPVIRMAREGNLWIRGYVSMAFGCPYEGKIAVDDVLRVTQALLEQGVEEVAISDTIGIATPGDVLHLMDSLGRSVPLTSLALHFHDTRGTGLANVMAGLEVGITTYDAAAGGLGGCPFAPGAAGNLATEDLVYALHGLGVETGVDLEAVVRATRFLQGAVGHPPASRYVAAAP